MKESSEVLANIIVRGISQYNRLISLNISGRPIFACKLLILNAFSGSEGGT